MHIIKNSFDLISEPLVKLINLSLSTATFPDKLKIAKVIPIYKTGDRDFFTNYRPISLLTNISKFFEKFMYNRLIEFIENVIFYTVVNLVFVKSLNLNGANSPSK